MCTDLMQIHWTGKRLTEDRKEGRKERRRLCAVLMVELRASCMLDQHSTTEPSPES